MVGLVAFVAALVVVAGVYVATRPPLVGVSEPTIARAPPPKEVAPPQCPDGRMPLRDVNRVDFLCISGPITDLIGCLQATGGGKEQLVEALQSEQALRASANMEFKALGLDPALDVFAENNAVKKVMIKYGKDRCAESVEKLTKDNTRRMSAISQAVKNNPRAQQALQQIEININSPIYSSSNAIYKQIPESPTVQPPPVSPSPASTQDCLAVDNNGVLSACVKAISAESVPNYMPPLWHVRVQVKFINSGSRRLHVASDGRRQNCGATLTDSNSTLIFTPDRCPMNASRSDPTQAAEARWIYDNGELVEVGHSLPQIFTFNSTEAPKPTASYNVVLAIDTVAEPEAGADKVANNLSFSLQDVKPAPQSPTLQLSGAAAH
jgi:hypothetical protein